MASNSLADRTFKNTFLPRCKNKELTVGMLIAGCRAGVVNLNALPDEVHEAISAELQRLKTVDE